MWSTGTPACACRCLKKCNYGTNTLTRCHLERSAAKLIVCKQQAIQNHLDAASDNQSAASQHLSALLGDDDYDDDYQDDGSEQSADKIARQKMRKARAASALIKVGEIEQSVARLRHEMESNNAEVSKSLHNLLALIEKLVGPRPEASRVARTTMPAITVRKEDDGGVKVEKGEKSVHELVKQALQNPQRSSDYTR